jgi:transcriptional regulator with XRE-family HTH domain
MIREAVEREMKRGEWTQTALAEAAKVSRANLCDWLGGRSSISVETLAKLMLVLRLRVTRARGEMSHEDRGERTG